MKVQPRELVKGMVRISSQARLSVIYALKQVSDENFTAKQLQQCQDCYKLNFEKFVFPKVSMNGIVMLSSDVKSSIFLSLERRSSQSQAF